MPMRRMASGDFKAERVSRNSAVPSDITATPGMNLRESSLGVVSVCMNMDLANRYEHRVLIHSKLRTYIGGVLAEGSVSFE